MARKEYSFTHALKKRPDHQFEVAMLLYDTQKEMMSEYKKDYSHPEDMHINGIFVPARENGKYIGSVRLNVEDLDPEVIIHECVHAGFEFNRHMGRRIPAKYEENIAYAIGQLSIAMLEMLFSFELKKED